MGTFPSEIAKELPGRQFNIKNRIILPQTITEWVEWKKINDQTTLGFERNPDLWCIDNKLYDLSDFFDSHPGGKSWLSNTRGMDITGYFYTHHMDHEKVKKILEKYYVQDLSYLYRASTNLKGLVDRNEMVINDLHTFKWDNDCNYFKLKKEIHQHLTKKYGPKYNENRWPMHISSTVIVIAWFIAFYFLCKYPSIYTAIIAGFLLHPFLGIGHNFFHQADSKGFMGIETLWRYIFNFTMFSFEDWRLSHAISHHLDINLNDDYEVSGFEPIVYFMTNTPTNSPFIYVYVHIFHFIFGAINYLLTGLKFKSSFIIHLWPLIQLAIIIGYNTENYCYLSEFATLCWYWLVMHGVCNWILIQVSSPVHRSDYCWSEGDINGSKDFLHHVLLSTVAYNVHYPLFLSMLFYEGFNDHRLHHLFPVLDISLLSDIRPIFEKYCNEHGFKEYVKLKYSLFPLWLGLMRNYCRVTQSK